MSSGTALPILLCFRKPAWMLTASEMEHVSEQFTVDTRTTARFTSVHKIPMACANLPGKHHGKPEVSF